MTILGLHHITLVCADAQRTVNFYVDVLGQRLVKKTVNFDDPGSYHLYFGDRIGRPGTAITFFEWPHAPKGEPGIGGTHHVALTVASFDCLLKWKRRLTDLGVGVAGPFNRKYFMSLYFSDPDGVNVEIATHGPGFTIDEPLAELGTAHQELTVEILNANRPDSRLRSETWTDPVPDITDDMALQEGMHHITAVCLDISRTHAFWSELMGLRRIKMASNVDDGSNDPHWYWSSGSGEPGTLLSYFERKSHRARMGAGQTHHFALAVKDETAQAEWREKMVRAGLPVSEVMDRTYFKSIYSRDPDGHIIELATVGPGFMVDEPEESLGQTLTLPPWLEGQRRDIEDILTPLHVPIWRAPQQKFDKDKP